MSDFWLGFGFSTILMLCVWLGLALRSYVKKREEHYE